MSLLNSILSSVVTDGLTNQISNKTGLSQDQTKKAIDMAMPLLMSALTKNSTTEQGASSLNSALDKHDGSVLDNLDIESLLKSEDGAKIIGHLLGKKSDVAEQAIAKETGAEKNQIADIMKIAGPILMGVLGKEKQTQGLDLSGLTNLLGEEKKAMKSDSNIQSMIFDFIDQNDDGNVVDDLLNFASKMFGNQK